MLYSSSFIHILAPFLPISTIYRRQSFHCSVNLPCNTTPHSCCYVYNRYRYSHWGHLVQTLQIPSEFKDKNSRSLVVTWVFCFTQVLYKQACFGLFNSLFVKRSPVVRLAFFFSYPVIAAPSSKILFVLSSPCQTKSLLFLRMGLLQRPLTLQLSRLRLQPRLPVTTTHRTLTTTPAPQPAAQEVSVFSCPCIRFPSRVFRARRRWSFSLALASVFLVSVFAFVLLVQFSHLCTSLQFSLPCYYFIFASVLQLQFSVCVASLVFASLFQLSFPSL